jgi:vacuolar protein sorting-associated protein 26
VDIQVDLKGENERKHVEVKVDKDQRESLPVYLDGESVSGTVRRDEMKLLNERP